MVGWRPTFSPLIFPPCPIRSPMVKSKQGAGGWFPLPQASSCCVNNRNRRNQPKSCKVWSFFFLSLSNKSPLIISKVFNERLEGVLTVERGLRVISIAQVLLCGGGSDPFFPKGPGAWQGWDTVLGTQDDNSPAGGSLWEGNKTQFKHHQF